MMRELTPRMSLIIDYIVLNEHCSIKSIADELNLSIRQVRYNIEKINILFEGTIRRSIIETNNKGDIVIQNRIVLSHFQSINNNSFKHTKNERIVLLMAIIAFNIDRLNMNELSRKLNVSRSTIKNDVEYIQGLLSRYHIELHYDKRFFLAGSFTEKDLFFFRLSTIHPLEYMLFKDSISIIEQLIYAYIINEKMNGIKPRILLPIIQTYFHEQDIYMKDSEYYLFCKVIYVYIWYSINHEVLPLHDTLSTVSYDLDLKPILKVIEKQYNICFSDITIQFLLQLIQTLNQTRKISYLSTDEIIVSFIFQLMIYLDKHDVQPHFYDDEALIQYLYSHLNGYIKKKNMPIMKSANIKLDVMEPLDQCLQSFYNEKRDLIDITDCNEQAYIKLYFLSSINRNSSCMKKKVLIISGVSLPIRLELKETLEQLFEIQVLDTISRFDLPFLESDKLQGADYLLFTEEAPQTYGNRYKVVHIQPILSESDIISLLESGIKSKKNMNNIEDHVLHIHTSTIGTFDIQFTDTLNEKVLHMYENVYVSYQLHSTQKTIIQIDKRHKKIYINIYHDTAIALLNMMFLYYKLCKRLIIQKLLSQRTIAECSALLNSVK